MLNRVTLLLLIVFLLPAVLLSQSKTVLRADGTVQIVKNGEEVKPLKNGYWQFNDDRPSSVVRMPFETQGLLDTLGYDLGYNTNFGAFGQDWLLQWFVAPADLTIKSVGVAGLEETTAGTTIELKVVKANWTFEQFQALTPSSSAGEKRWGYYPAAGNGFTEITAFRGNTDKTGDWVPIQSTTAEPWGDDMWSDNGTPYPITNLIWNDTEPEFTWVALDILTEPTVLKGEIFGIAVKNTSTVMDQVNDRAGFWAAAAYGGFNGWKFYAAYRSSAPPNPPDYGWWSRNYIWDFVAAVDITGDIGPSINSYTELASGLDAGPFTVEANISDINPGNPAQQGVASAVLQYSLDEGTTWTDVAMTGTEPNFTGIIPAQAANQWVVYKIVASDNNNNVTTSPETKFFIFAPSGVPTLVIFNGDYFENLTTGYPQDYYFGETMIYSGETGATKSFLHDRWSYGAIPDVEFLNNYTNVLEIVVGEPIYNDELIRTWLNGNASRNYFLSGQEFLGARFGYANRDFAAGSFEYDILGVTHSYNDLTVNSAGSQLPTALNPVDGTEFGGPLFTLYNSFSPKPDSLMYHPYYEIGDANWQDAFDVRTGVTVDVTVDTSRTNAKTYLPTMAHHTLQAGNKVAFAAFDPLSINTALRSSYSYYHWVGYTEASPVFQALEWFGVNILTDVREVGGTPTTFELTQNYPNPFNPATTINFSIPKASNVSLKVFDVLGKEVVTLLNAEKTAGNYEVKFDASKLPSGVYFYTLTTGDLSLTKKMMLMK